MYHFQKYWKLYTKRILDEGEDDLFKDDDLINLNITEKNKFKIKGSISVDLIYNGEMDFFPILVSFEKDDIKKKYEMFTQKYFDKIYNEMNFINPMLLIGNSCNKYENKKNYLFTEFNEEDKIYKILKKRKLYQILFYYNKSTERT